jgi:hypothetical protein
MFLNKFFKHAKFHVAEDAWIRLSSNGQGSQPPWLPRRKSSSSRRDFLAL